MSELNFSLKGLKLSITHGSTTIVDKFCLYWPVYHSTSSFPMEIFHSRTTFYIIYNIIYIIYCWTCYLLDCILCNCLHYTLQPLGERPVGWTGPKSTDRAEFGWNGAEACLTWCGKPVLLQIQVSLKAAEVQLIDLSISHLNPTLNMTEMHAMSQHKQYTAESHMKLSQTPRNPLKHLSACNTAPFSLVYPLSQIWYLLSIPWCCICSTC